MLGALTLERIQPYVGETFLLVASAETTLSCELVETRSYGARSAAVTADTGRTESFSITFCLPADAPLEQGMYTLSHPTLGVLQNLFLVPVSADAKGRYFEAVFN